MGTIVLQSVLTQRLIPARAYLPEVPRGPWKESINIFLSANSPTNLNGNPEHRGDLAELVNSSPLGEGKQMPAAEPSYAPRSQQQWGLPPPRLLRLWGSSVFRPGPQLETHWAVCSAAHPAHPLFGGLAPLWVACRCDLTHLELLSLPFSWSLKIPLAPRAQRASWFLCPPGNV